MRLDGKVSIITGGGSGMGRVAAELFAREGSRVVVADFSEAAGVESEPKLAPLRDGELERSGLDSTLAEKDLSWKAETPFDTGIDQTYKALVAEFEAEG